MREYETYDGAVDIVSAFEYILTQPPDMAATVEHFERFPKIRTSAAAPDTPDFTVLYTDGTALIGEIARLSLQPKSVESVCDQLDRYSRLAQIPDASGHLTTVTDVDVIQFVPLEVGPDAIDRIIYERFLNPDHPFKPTKAPCIVQFGRTTEKYMFQRINDTENGILNGHGRNPNLAERIRQLNVKAAGFASTKATSKFMNDPVKALYLAVILYTQVWPTDQRGKVEQATITPADTARSLQQRYGAGTANDVRNTMTLLISAGLAADNKDGTFTVSKQPRVKDEHNLAKVIAQRSADQAKPLVRPARAAAAAPESQLSLFD